MEIKIDTDKESKENLKKLVKLLSALVGEDMHTNVDLSDVPDTPAPDTGSALANLFDNQDFDPEVKEVPDEDEVPSVEFY